MGSERLSYQFDGILVEPEEFRIMRNGKALEIEPKAFQVLLLLIHHRGRLVTKDQILDAIWKDAFVTQNALTRVIAQIRRVLGSPGKNSYIETVPTRGYRFVADVTEGSEDLPAIRPASPRPGKTIAVLPFKVLNADHDNGYLSVGLADSLISKLSNIDELTVRPTSSIIRFANPDADIIQAGRDLRVEHVIDGAVQSAGESVRVTVRFVRVADGKPLWAEVYQGEFVSFFQVQDDISTRIADSLRIRMSNEELTRLSKRPTMNIEAYRLCLRGNHHLYRLTPDDWNIAFQCFNEAVSLDAGYALAYAGLASVYMIGMDFGVRCSAEQIKGYAATAIELDPDLAEAHAMLGAFAFWQERDSAAAARHFEQAMFLNSNSANIHHFYSWFLIATGCFDDAQTHLRRALEIDPLSPGIITDQGMPFYFSRRFSEARRLYERAVELEPDFGYAHFRLSEALEILGDCQNAIGEFEKATALTGGNNISKAQLARVLALSGKRREAQKLIANSLKDAKAQPASYYYIALACVSLGENDEALERLERAILENDKWLGWAKVDPRLDPVRNDPKFIDILRRLNFSQ